MPSGQDPQNHKSGFAQAMKFWKNYVILKRKFHIWKNYGIFVLVDKNVCFLRKDGGKIGPDLDVVSMFVALVITSLALRNTRAIALAYCSAA